jgi:ATP-dependent DNA ligase
VRSSRRALTLRRSQISIGRNEPGRRSGAWVKVKLTQQQQEFVIGGYTPPEGSRKYLGALLVGYYGPEGLLFAGRVGTGFSERALEALYDGFQKIRRTLTMLAWFNFPLPTALIAAPIKDCRRDRLLLD